MNRPVVMKFGGTSLADGSAFRRVVNHVRSEGRTPVVVLSAVGGVTDELEALVDCDPDCLASGFDAVVDRHLLLIAELKMGSEASAMLRGKIEHTRDGVLRWARAAESDATRPALRDRILACGEIWSSLVFSTLLEASGMAHRWLDVRSIMRTDNQFGQAIPDRLSIERLVRYRVVPVIRRNCPIVTQGFVGASQSGDTTTLGRGGSDYSAAILGEALDAEEIQIWTDVDGIFSADPSSVGSAHRIDYLSYREAATLSQMGAKVLHPKTIAPAARRRIPLRVLDSTITRPIGTVIGAETPCSDALDFSITSRKEVRLIRLRPMFRSISEVTVQVLQRLKDLSLNLWLMSQMGSYLQFVVDDGSSLRSGFLDDLGDTWSQAFGLIALVSNELEQRPSHRFGEFLKSESIDAIEWVSPMRSNCLVFLVAPSLVDDTVIKLHDYHREERMFSRVG